MDLDAATIDCQGGLPRSEPATITSQSGSGHEMKETSASKVGGDGSCSKHSILVATSLRKTTTAPAKSARASGIRANDVIKTIRGSSSSSSSEAAGVPSSPILAQALHQLTMDELLVQFAESFSRRNQDMTLIIRQLTLDLTESRKHVAESRTEALDWCAKAKKLEQERDLAVFRLENLEQQMIVALQQARNDLMVKTKTTQQETIVQQQEPLVQQHQEAEGIQVAINVASHVLNTQISQTLHAIYPSRKGDQIVTPKKPTVDNNPEKSPAQSEISRLMASETRAYSRDIDELDEESLQEGQEVTEPVAYQRTLHQRCDNDSSSEGVSTVVSNKASNKQLHAWKARCSIAESQATMWHMKYEKMRILLDDVYIPKWERWRKGYMQSAEASKERRRNGGAGEEPRQHRSHRSSSLLPKGNETQAHNQHQQHSVKEISRQKYQQQDNRESPLVSDTISRYKHTQPVNLKTSSPSSASSTASSLEGRESIRKRIRLSDTSLLAVAKPPMLRTILEQDRMSSRAGSPGSATEPVVLDDDEESWAVPLSPKQPMGRLSNDLQIDGEPAITKDAEEYPPTEPVHMEGTSSSCTTTADQRSNGEFDQDHTGQRERERMDLLSPTFPSDLALLRRSQGFHDESSDENDNDDNNVEHNNDKKKIRPAVVPATEDPMDLSRVKNSLVQVGPDDEAGGRENFSQLLQLVRAKDTNADSQAHQQRSSQQKNRHHPHHHRQPQQQQHIYNLDSDLSSPPMFEAGRPSYQQVQRVSGLDLGPPLTMSESIQLQVQQQRRPEAPLIPKTPNCQFSSTKIIVPKTPDTPGRTQQEHRPTGIATIDIGNFEQSNHRSNNHLSGKGGEGPLQPKRTNLKPNPANVPVTVHAIATKGRAVGDSNVRKVNFAPVERRQQKNLDDAGGGGGDMDGGDDDVDVDQYSDAEESERHNGGNMEENESVDGKEIENLYPANAAATTTIAVSGGRVFNETERLKHKRKQMHGSTCTCCAKFYEMTGPLPRPDGYNSFFTPRKAAPNGLRGGSQSDDEERLQSRIQANSRHRVQHELPLTPPGYWNTDFPSSQERQQWDEIAKERRERGKQRLLQQQQQQHRHHGDSYSNAIDKGKRVVR